MEAAIVDVDKVGGGPVANINHPKKLTVNVSVMLPWSAHSVTEVHAVRARTSVDDTLMKLYQDLSGRFTVSDC